MARPSLFKDMIASLRACDLDGWQIHIAAEPGPHQSDLAEICNSDLAGADFELTINENILGIRENPRAVINRAFEGGSSLTVYLEEDFVVAPDALELALWYRRNHKPHWACLNLLAGTCGSAGNLSDPSDPTAVFETRCFNSIGVGFARADWGRLEQYWVKPTTLRRGGMADIGFSGWDWSILKGILMNADWRVVAPLTGRCNHKGTNGVNCDPAFQRAAFDRLTVATRNADDARLDGFKLANIAELPPMAAAHLNSQLDAVERLRQQISNAVPEISVLRSSLSRLNRYMRGREL